MIYPMPHSMKWGGRRKAQIFLAIKLGSVHSIPCSGSVARRYSEIRMALSLGMASGRVWKAWVAVDEPGWRGALSFAALE